MYPNSQPLWAHIPRCLCARNSGCPRCLRPHFSASRKGEALCLSGSITLLSRSARAAPHPGSAQPQGAQGTGRGARTAGQILLHPLPHANEFLVLGAPQLTRAFAPCIVHPTFYPDLTKPARLTPPSPSLPRLEPARCLQARNTSSRDFPLTAHSHACPQTPLHLQGPGSPQ